VETIVQSLVQHLWVNWVGFLGSERIKCDGTQRDGYTQLYDEIKLVVFLFCGSPFALFRICSVLRWVLSIFLFCKNFAKIAKGVSIRNYAVARLVSAIIRAHCIPSSHFVVLSSNRVLHNFLCAFLNLRCLQKEISIKRRTNRDWTLPIIESHPNPNVLKVCFVIFQIAILCEPIRIIWWGDSPSIPPTVNMTTSFNNTQHKVCSPSGTPVIFSSLFASKTDGDSSLLKFIPSYLRGISHLSTI